jgi:hypothetical protein
MVDTFNAVRGKPHDVLDRTPHKRGISLNDADIYDEFYNKVYDTINVPTTQLKRCWLINTKPQIRATTYFGRGVRDRNGFERIV